MTHPAIADPFFKAAEQGRFRDAALLARKILHGGGGSIIARESSVPSVLRMALMEAGLVVLRDFERFYGDEFGVRITPDGGLRRFRHEMFDPDLGYVLSDGQRCPICGEAGKVEPRRPDLAVDARSGFTWIPERHGGVLVQGTDGRLVTESVVVKRLHTV